MFATIFIKKGFKVHVCKEYVTDDEEVLILTGKDGIEMNTFIKMGLCCSRQSCTIFVHIKSFPRPALATLEQF